jgi:S-adenosylmethionine hydrolase
MAAPLVTLLTDFGTADGYAGALKGVLLSICPEARIVDLTHEVPPGDVRAGAFALACAARTFPPATIHIAVVDPGVGTERRGLLVEAAGAAFVGPDNGLLSLAARAPRRIRSLDRPQWFRHPVSRTFHGRDVFAPVAARLANGTPAHELGTEVREMMEICPEAPRRSADGSLEGEVMHVDRFGNLITNVSEHDLAALLDRSGATAGSVDERLAVEIAGRTAFLLPTYGAAPGGSLLALIGSAGLLEVAVNGGAAHATLGASVGTRVRVHREVG